MILAFSNEDSDFEVFEFAEQANRWLEAIDVEGGEYTFLDERGFRLEPVFGPPVRKKWLGFLPWTYSDYGPFTFTATEERGADLVRKLRSGELKLRRTQAKIRTLDDLRRITPCLFTP